MRYRPFQPSLYDDRLNNRTRNQWYDPRANNGHANNGHYGRNYRYPQTYGRQANAGYAWRIRNPEDYESLSSMAKQLVDQYMTDFWQALPNLLRSIAKNDDEYSTMLKIIEKSRPNLTAKTQTKAVQTIISQLREAGFKDHDIFSVQSEPPQIAQFAQEQEIIKQQPFALSAPMLEEPPIAAIPPEILGDLDRMEQEILAATIKVLPEVVAQAHKEGLI